MLHTHDSLLLCGHESILVTTPRHDNRLHAYSYSSDGRVRDSDVTRTPLTDGEEFRHTSSYEGTVVQMAATRTYTLLLTTLGHLYAYGTHLPTIPKTTTKKQKTTRLHRIALTVSVRHIACGPHYAMLITGDGQLLVHGRNTCGQLGLGNREDAAGEFQPVSAIDEPVVQVACGGSHTLILTASGRLLACGSNARGQLGLGIEVSSQTQPRFVMAGVVQIAAGEKHSVVQTGDGHLWAWGLNTSGQLGLGDTEPRWLPARLPHVACLAASIVCGAFHTMVLLLRSGCLFACGDNFACQLGCLPAGDNQSALRLITDGVATVACRNYMSVILHRRDDTVVVFSHAPHDLLLTQ
jgi:alpha-tubulin suppressor-like RCC1 family protein